MKKRNTYPYPSENRDLLGLSLIFTTLICCLLAFLFLDGLSIKQLKEENEGLYQSLRIYIQEANRFGICHSDYIKLLKTKNCR